MSLKTLAAGVFACAMATGMALANVKAADVSPWGNWMLGTGKPRQRGPVRATRFTPMWPSLMIPTILTARRSLI